jgi:hypothetical protein
MPILNNDPAQNHASDIATKLRSTSNTLFKTLLTSWQLSMRAIWLDENPQAIFTELGTDAGELCALSGRTAAFLESLVPGCTAKTLALAKPFTVESDGRVTINP